MTPHQFERDYAPLWQELARGLDRLDRGRRKPPAQGKGGHYGPVDTLPPVGAARVADLYRQACDHLALARERAYPVHLVEQLETLTARAHQRIYRRTDFGLAALLHLVAHDIPVAVRALAGPLWLTTALFVLAMVGAGLATWHDPHFILTIVDAEQVSHFDQMYGPAADHLGRTAGDDVTMFGFYIVNNIGIAFRCFAAGLTFGVGSLFVIVSNGLSIGGVAGYLVTRGDALRFFSFVVTHSAFELTAIVLSGACGLRLGQALLMPGRLTRVQALRAAATATAPVVYGLFGMLVIAAALEAFWSSAAWVDPVVKFGAGAACWTLVLAYLLMPGRTPRPRTPAARGRA
jgi:uncharacterized membrane protein SpoIIM required for sporulation